MSKPKSVPTCKYCGRPIMYLLTKKGSWIPVDRESVTPGHDVHWDGSQTPHVKTCPNYHRPCKRGQDQMTLELL